MIDSTAEISITNVLVNASGRNRRPAWPVSVKTGRNATAMISSEKKIAGVTSLAASASSACRSAPLAFGACSSRLCAASIITISASTVAPIAMAMPPRLMMVDGMSSSAMGMNDSATLIGSDRIGSSELRMCNRNRMITRLTVIPSSISACFSVSIERPMRAERS